MLSIYGSLSLFSTIFFLSKKKQTTAKQEGSFKHGCNLGTIRKKQMKVSETGSDELQPAMRSQDRKTAKFYLVVNALLSGQNNCPVKIIQNKKIVWTIFYCPRCQRPRFFPFFFVYFLSIWRLICCNFFIFPIAWYFFQKYFTTS